MRTATIAALSGMLSITLAAAEEQQTEEQYLEAVSCKVALEATHHPRAMLSVLKVDVVLHGYVESKLKTQQQIDEDVGGRRAGFAQLSFGDRTNLLAACLRKFPPGD